jgi:hypothetical protein
VWLKWIRTEETMLFGLRNDALWKSWLDSKLLWKKGNNVTLNLFFALLEKYFLLWNRFFTCFHGFPKIIFCV